MPDSTSTVAKPATEDPSTDTPKDKWTLMFLIMGDAGLSASMISQLKELKDAGFQEDTNVLLYFDPNCNGKGARIYDVNHDRKQRSVESAIIGDGTNPFVRNIAEDCSVQSLQQFPATKTLHYFLTYSRTYYPAENYMLFLMGHGVIVGNDEFLPDTDDNSSITLKDLGKILRNFGSQVRDTGDEFHLVGFHSCGMSSVELAFELEGSARYMMGTQGSAFPGSWPYRQILKKIFNSMERIADVPGDPYPNELVQEILRGLQDLSFYNARDFSDAGFSADLSICSLDEARIKELKEALQNLVSKLKIGLTNGAKDSILLAHLDSQSYFGESYSDLYDFCARLLEHSPGDEIRTACEAVKGLLESEKCDDKKKDPDGYFHKPVVFSDYYGPAYQHSNGLSIFFPWQAPIEKVMTNYERYKFTEELGSDSWMSFLQDYFNGTKRPMNGDKQPADKIAGKARLRSEVQGVTTFDEQLLPTDEKPFPPDDEVLRLGPPPAQKPLAVAERIKIIHQEVRALAKRMQTFKGKTGTRKNNKETVTRANERRALGGKIAAMEMETTTLVEETAPLVKETAKLTKTVKKTVTLVKETTATLAKTVKETATLEVSEKGTAPLAKEMAALATKMATLAANEMASLGVEGMETLATDLTTLEKDIAALAGAGAAPLAGKDIASLAKETATLAKKMAALAAKEMASLAAEGMETLAPKLISLEKKTATLAGKETGSLAKEMGSLAKETATLAKETGSLAKETGSLSKETGSLAKETGSLSKETGSLAKETATLGFSGKTIIKNFDAPEGRVITSRPQGIPNRGVNEESEREVESSSRLRKATQQPRVPKKLSARAKQQSLKAIANTKTEPGRAKRAAGAGK